MTLATLAGCASTVAGTAVPGAPGIDVTAYPTTDYPTEDRGETGGGNSGKDYSTGSEPTGTGSTDSTDSTGASFPPVDPSSPGIAPPPLSDAESAPSPTAGTPSAAETSSTRTSSAQGAATHRGKATVSNGTISIAVGKPDRRITIYQEPMCPPCGEFQQRWGADIDAAIDAGTLRVDLVTMTFLDSQSSSGDYSTRAATALLAVATAAGDRPGVVQNFEAALFSPDVMPSEGGGTDLSSDELAALAVEAGLPASDAKAVAKPSAKLTAAATAAAGKATERATGTPTVLDATGTKLNIDDDEWLASVLK
ncbi:DsbA family protein [Nakamurella aerolata]|uniref:Thioredoxin domain-containing protein n=1 Tax=Nakamurella aerolata TaxID=1656892 RepID=A0A849A8D0_9ACTN|nr:thioredoxin domain-containing protein [Nakamurella aerolata]NNG35876.1 thioredoxin domain-containing protein [Nakamurella aerolata]